MDLLKEIKKLPKEIEIVEKNGTSSFVGFCVRYRTTLQKWSVGYGKSVGSSRLGLGDTIEEAFSNFLSKKS